MGHGRGACSEGRAGRMQWIWGQRGILDAFQLLVWGLAGETVAQDEIAESQGLGYLRREEGFLEEVISSGAWQEWALEGWGLRVRRPQEEFWPLCCPRQATPRG